MLIGLPLAEENVSEPFSLTDPLAGPVMSGANGLTVIATLAEADRLSPGSET